jgi:hypothetical protein
MATKTKNTIHCFLSILVAVVLLAPQGQSGQAAPAAPTAAPAAPAAAAAGTITPSPASGAPGTRILVTGSFPNFGSADSVTLWWDYVYDGRFLGSTSLRAGGSFALPVVIPPEAAPGEHPIVADVNYGYDQASAAFNVTQANLKALYIYYDDTDTALSFQFLLNNQGFPVTLVTLAALPEVDLSTFNVILIGDDTNSGQGWSGMPENVKRLKASGKPILGLGHGGAWFFEALDLDIGWMNTGGFPQIAQVAAVDPAHPIWNRPYRIYLSEGQATLYTQAVVGYGVLLEQSLPGVQELGRVAQYPSYYPLAEEDARYLLWGYSGSSSIMTAAGKDLLINTLWNLVHAGQVDTLVLTDFTRMEDVGYSHADVISLTNDLSNLIGLPKYSSNMVAIHRDLSDDGPDALLTARTNWDANENSLANTYAYVNAIDSYIESLKAGSYKNLLYVIIVGAHEIIPQYPRPADDMSDHKESNWANDLPQTSGYFYSLYHDTSDGKGFGHYLTDSVYSDLSYIDNGRGADNVLIPELAVGRLVETPAQISVLVRNYIASSGTLRDDDMAAIGSHDYMDGAQQAANYMGATADTALIQNGFTSNLVAPKMNAENDIIYIGGHGDYNWTTTRTWDQGFMAGATAAQGDTEELVNLPDAVVVASGCHNGVNFGNRLYHDYTGNTDYGDFPERYANKQVGVYLGSTGYTWISASGSSSNAAYTGWSEKLATHFLKHLFNDGFSVTVGKAYKSAVNEYVTDYGTITDEHRRVISIANLYGIPNYSWPRLYFHFPLPLFQVRYWLKIVWVVWPAGGTHLAASAASQEITFENNQWSVEPDGLISILGAKYTGNSNEPVLPIVSASQILPPGSHALNIVFDEAGSESVTIPNDVPLASMAVLTTTMPNAFDYAGFYPPTPYYTTTLTTLGGEGVQIDFSIIPVQYDISTHQTRIWTRMHFTVQYDLDAEALAQDADGDGLPDYWESAYGLDPNDSAGDQGASGDPDQDGLTNAQEYSRAVNTNPMDADTDDDGFTDGAEVIFGSDPLNPGSYPHSLYLPVVKK